jgi:hypothetical protein
MRRFVILTLAPLAFAGLFTVGCGSNNGEADTTSWNDKNPWGEHRASQAGTTMEPGTATALPPTTQPAR